MSRRSACAKHLSRSATEDVPRFGSAAAPRPTIRVATVQLGGGNPVRSSRTRRAEPDRLPKRSQAELAASIVTVLSSWRRSDRGALQLPPQPARRNPECPPALAELLEGGHLGRLDEVGDERGDPGRHGVRTPIPRSARLGSQPLLNEHRGGGGVAEDLERDRSGRSEHFTGQLLSFGRTGSRPS